MKTRGQCPAETTVTGGDKTVTVRCFCQKGHIGQHSGIAGGKLGIIHWD